MKIYEFHRRAKFSQLEILESESFAVLSILTDLRRVSSVTDFGVPNEGSFAI